MKVSELWILIRYKLGWAAIICLTLIPVLAVWGESIEASTPFNFFGILLALGKLTGVAGLMLYSLNLILATRLRFMEKYFGGLNRMYIAHHLSGGIALILLAFHPLLLAFRYLSPVTKESFRTAAEFLWLHHISFGMLSGYDMAINYGIVALFGMVVLLILTFYIHLPYRIWLFTHKFLGAAFFFAGLHVLFIPSDVSRDTAIRWYLLTWVALGLISAIYRTLGGRILIRKYDYRVESVAPGGKGVIQLTLQPVDRTLNFQPGQFVFITFKYSGVKGVTTEAHPFSISSAPTEGKLRLDVKALGDYTKSLLELKPGAIAEIEGAYGKFSYKNYDNPNQIWVAGGIGITPFLSMARSLKPDQKINVDLYYSVKSTDELVDYQTLASIMSTESLKFRLIPHVADKSGFLTAEVIEKLSGTLQEKDFYICGPPPMMKSIKAQLKAKGVQKFRMHSEEFAMS